VRCPQPRKQFLIRAGPVHHGAQLVRRHEHVLTDQVGEDHRARIEALEPQRQQLPAMRGQRRPIGGNSGPSNVDGHHGEGGVHRHRWNAPAKQGKPLPAGPRLLMLKSPMMKGADVEAVQQALNQHNHAGLAADGIYNPATRDAVVNWQRHEHIEVDGIVGPHTRSTLGLSASMHVPA
jgi:putative peptidoglycan binding protein